MKTFRVRKVGAVGYTLSECIVQAPCPGTACIRAGYLGFNYNPKTSSFLRAFDRKYEYWYNHPEHMYSVRVTLV